MLLHVNSAYINTWVNITINSKNEQRMFLM